MIGARFSLTELLRMLVEIPSVSGQEQAIARWVAEFCRNFGHEVWDVNGSVAVRIRGRNRRRAFIKNGHLDTVPGDWPGGNEFVLRYIEGELVGLGASDMKAGLAVMLMFAQIYGLHNPPPCDVWLFFSREEETTAQGSLDLAAWWSLGFSGEYDQAMVVILEPTDNAFVAPWHKGGGVFVATATAETSYHGSTNLGGHQTPIGSICRLGIQLQQLQATWNHQQWNSRRYGLPTVNATAIATPTNVLNAVGLEARMWIDLRTTDAFTALMVDELLGELEELCGGGLTIPRRPEIVRPSENDADVALAAFAAGWPLPVKAFAAATDMDAFTAIGLPTVICGPGTGSRMHQVIVEGLPEGAMEVSVAGLDNVMHAFA